MSDTIAIAAVTLAMLLMLSFMLAMRLRAGGASTSQTNRLIGELWVTVGIVAALLVATANVLGAPGAASAGLGAELGDIGRRFAALNAQSKALAATGAAMALALFVHLLHALNRAMRAAPPPS